MRLWCWDHIGNPLDLAEGATTSWFRFISESSITCSERAESPLPLGVDSAASTTAGEESAIGRSARAWPQIPPIPSINRLLS